MKSLFTAALLCCCALVQAQVQAQPQSTYWIFTYTGFYDQEAAAFLPELTLTGSFSGMDADADGALEREELQSLVIGDTDYVACAAGSNAYYHCGADRFLFTPNHDLSFSLGTYGSDPEGWVGGGHVIESGSLDYTYRFSPGSSAERHLYWTDGTVLAMSPIPAPAGWAMLLAGLASLAWWKRRIL